MGVSRSWQDSVIYFVLTDRFYNGDRSNDDMGQDEFRPDHDDYFQGGDLRGIIMKLPHIKKLGVDALWITPPVHNQWVNPYVGVRGYHGYWAHDFTKVDPHLGTLEDYKELVREAHRHGIKVIQDIVVNHTGNYFTVDEKGTWKQLPGGAPNDPVFRMNNPNDPEHRKAAVYNFTPNIADFKDREQTLKRALGDLDDINLHSPLAVKRMKEIYRYWIEEVGVDGFRVDTVYYTPEDFYEKFLYDEDGIKRSKDFFVFGEVWSYDYKAINRYLQDGETTRLDSAIDLPLNEALTKVFFRMSPTDVLRPVLKSKRFRRGLWVNFLDNHDVERMASRTTPAKERQALVAMFTLPGIPCVYYGTEAGLKTSRQNMFREEYYDDKSESFRFVRDLVAFRRAHPAFSRGTLQVERSSLAPGVLAYSRSHKGESYLAVFNTSTNRMFYELASDASDYRVLLSSEKADRVERSFILPPDSYCVLKRTGVSEPRASRPLKLEPLKGTAKGTVEVSFALDGAAPVSSLSLLCNDDYDARIPIGEPDAGRFPLDTGLLGNGKHKVQLLAQTRSGDFRLSNDFTIKVRNRYKPLARLNVPRSERTVAPPADPSYQGQLSMEKVRVYSSGRDLRLMIKMRQVTNEWNPPNGYDHVYFNVFFDFPGQPGRGFLPKLNCRMDDFDFNLGFLLYGWGSLSYGANDSSETAYGAPLIGEVEQAVDLKNRTIVFTFSKRYFESLTSFAGTSVLITTWDGYLSELREISDTPENWKFFSPSGRKDGPKIFDRARITL